MQAKHGDNFTEVVTLCPFFTLGPMLTKHSSSSIEGLRKIISGEVPGIPKLQILSVDVRDVAHGFVKALTADPGTLRGERILLQ